MYFALPRIRVGVMRILLATVGLLCWPSLFAAAVDKEMGAKVITGVRGTVTITVYRPRYMPLLRPGQVYSPPPQLPPAPGSGLKLRVLAADNDTVVKEVTTDPEGKLLIDLPAGEYRLQIVPDMRAFGVNDIKFKVTAGKISELGTVEMRSRSQ